MNSVCHPSAVSLSRDLLVLGRCPLQLRNNTNKTMGERKRHDLKPRNPLTHTPPLSIPPAAVSRCSWWRCEVKTNIRPLTHTHPPLFSSAAQNSCCVWPTPFLLFFLCLRSSVSRIFLAKIDRRATAASSQEQDLSAQPTMRFLAATAGLVERRATNGTIPVYVRCATRVPFVVPTDLFQGNARMPRGTTRSWRS